MEEKEVVDAVSKWLSGQGFTVREEFLLDETGRPAVPRRPDLPEAEKYVLGWVRAYRAGVTQDELVKGLSGQVAPDVVQDTVERLVEGGELERRGTRLLMGLGPRSGAFILPSQVRPDLFGFRGGDRIERWSVECKGSRGNVAHGIGQTYLYAKATDRAFLAIPSDWPPIYPTPKRKEPSWAALRRAAQELGFNLLRVGPNGTVNVV